MSDEPATCGEGLAAHSLLPARLAELMARTAAVLHDHRRSLDPDDAASRAEDDAYRDLVAEFRALADHLNALARQMASRRDLPMGVHDETVLGSPECMENFAALVRAERELLTVLQQFAGAHESMLGASP